MVIGAIALWRWTSFGESVSPERIAEGLEAIENAQLAPLYFIAAYVVGGLVMFPVTVLGAASAIVFPPLKAMAVSFTGIMLSAALLYGIGARLLKKSVAKTLEKTIQRVDAAMSDRGIVTIATVRMIPLAPFTLVNIAAGVIGVRFRDYMLGTALGLAPGMTVVCIFGRQVRAFWSDPNLEDALVALAIGIVWIAASLAIQRWLIRRKKG